MVRRRSGRESKGGKARWAGGGRAGALRWRGQPLWGAATGSGPGSACNRFRRWRFGARARAPRPHRVCPAAVCDLAGQAHATLTWSNAGRGAGRQARGHGGRGGAVPGGRLPVLRAWSPRQGALLQGGRRAPGSMLGQQEQQPGVCVSVCPRRPEDRARTSGPRGLAQPRLRSG